MQSEKLPAGKLPVKEKIRQYRWNFEGRSIPMGVGCAWVSADNEDDGLQVLLKSYEAGFRYYDTSRRYGESELVVGRAYRTWRPLSMPCVPG
jgi:diketogulonate reductase-like aldo/keto reductase